MKANEVVTYINQPGVDAKMVRSYARKYFVKTDATWDFNDNQVAELKSHFNAIWNKRQALIDEIKAESVHPTPEQILTHIKNDPSIPEADYFDLFCSQLPSSFNENETDAGELFETTMHKLGLL